MLALTPDAPHVLAKLLIKRKDWRGQTAVRILDLGAGSGVLWNDVLEITNGLCRIELTLADGAPVLWSEKIFAGTKKSVKERLVISLPLDLAAIPSKSFDVVTAFEVIEHLSVDDGYRLLYEMERISSGVFGISTPSGFQWQPPSPNNPLNAHISGWSAKDLRRYGFQKLRGHGKLIVRVLGGYEFGGPLRFLPKPATLSTGQSAWRYAPRDAQKQEWIAPLGPTPK